MPRYDNTGSAGEGLNSSGARSDARDADRSACGAIKKERPWGGGRRRWFGGIRKDRSAESEVGRGRGQGFRWSGFRGLGFYDAGPPRNLAKRTRDLDTFYKHHEAQLDECKERLKKIGKIIKNSK